MLNTTPAGGTLPAGVATTLASNSSVVPNSSGGGGLYYVCSGCYNQRCLPPGSSPMICERCRHLATGDPKVLLTRRLKPTEHSTR